jgi:hypothetical protein
LGREQLANTDNSHIRATIVVLTTRLTELTVPERLVTVHLERVTLKASYNGSHIAYGDNNIIPIHAHLTMEGLNVPPGERSLELILNSKKD